MVGTALAARGGASLLANRHGADVIPFESKLAPTMHSDSLLETRP